MPGLLNLESSIESIAVAQCTDSHAFFHYFKRTRRVTTRLLKIAKEIPDIQHLRRPRYDSTEDSRLKQLYPKFGGVCLATMPIIPAKSRAKKP